jgi:hypothetical protein
MSNTGHASARSRRAGEARRCGRGAPRGGARWILPLLGLLAVPACSISNLSVPMALRDLDAAVEVRGVGVDQSVSYRTEVVATAGIARWWLLKPIRPVLLWIFGERVPRTVENPSEYVRDLLTVLGDKATSDPLLCAELVQRFVRIAMLDPSALNRIVAIDGLARIAELRGVELLGTVAQDGVVLAAPERGEEWLERFAALRPAARQPIGSALDEEQRAAYVSAMAGLVERPLPHWSQRLALAVDLAHAVRDERQTDLRVAAGAALAKAVEHAVRWAVLESLAGRDPEWVEVRVRALEALRSSGGPDSMPLLLALLAASPEAIAAGTPQFEEAEPMRLRLIRLCGQLDEARALRSVSLPMRGSWERVAPAEFLARTALVGDPYSSAFALPAREALAVCLNRTTSDLAGDLERIGEDWVAAWYADFQSRRGGL